MGIAGWGSSNSVAELRHQLSATIMRQIHGVLSIWQKKKDASNSGKNL